MGGKLNQIHKRTKGSTALFSVDEKLWHSLTSAISHQGDRIRSAFGLKSDEFLLFLWAFLIYKPQLRSAVNLTSHWRADFCWVYCAERSRSECVPQKGFKLLVHSHPKWRIWCLYAGSPQAVRELNANRFCCCRVDHDTNAMCQSTECNHTGSGSG